MATTCPGLRAGDGEHVRQLLRRRRRPGRGRLACLPARTRTQRARRSPLSTERRQPTGPCSGVPPAPEQGRHNGFGFDVAGEHDFHYLLFIFLLLQGHSIANGVIDYAEIGGHR